MKKQRIRGKERTVIATRQALMQQVNILTPTEKEELNKQLDELDAMSKEDHLTHRRRE